MNMVLEESHWNFMSCSHGTRKISFCVFVKEKLLLFFLGGAYLKKSEKFSSGISGYPEFLGGPCTTPTPWFRLRCLVSGLTEWVYWISQLQFLCQGYFGLYKVISSVFVPIPVWSSSGTFWCSQLVPFWKGAIEKYKKHT